MCDDGIIKQHPLQRLLTDATHCCQVVPASRQHIAYESSYQKGPYLNDAKTGSARKQYVPFTRRYGIGVAYLAPFPLQQIEAFKQDCQADVSNAKSG